MLPRRVLTSCAHSHHDVIAATDATVIKEFNLDTKQFVSENSFNVDEAKTSIGYKSRDVVLIGTDTGDGSLTDSGYPRVVLEWKRGTPLASATKVYEGEKEDVSVNGYTTHPCHTP